MTFTHVHVHKQQRRCVTVITTSPVAAAPAITNIHLIDQDDLLKQFVGKLQGRIEVLKY